MKIETIVTRPEGDYVFTAALTPIQHTFLLEYAIRDLIARGLMPVPVTIDAKHDVVTVAPIVEPNVTPAS